jgi:hypothetical protein
MLIISDDTLRDAPEFHVWKQHEVWILPGIRTTEMTSMIRSLNPLVNSSYDTIFLQVGSHDLLSGINEAGMVNNVRNLMRAVNATFSGAAICFSGIPPRSDLGAYELNTANSILRDEAGNMGFSFTDPGLSMGNKMMSPSGTRLNKAGVNHWLQCFLRIPQHLGN